MFSIVVYSCLVYLQSFRGKLYFLRKNVIWIAQLFHLGIPTFGSKFVGLHHQHSFPVHISNRAIASFQFHIEWEEYRGPEKVQQ